MQHSEVTLSLAPEVDLENNLSLLIYFYTETGRAPERLLQLRKSIVNESSAVISLELFRGLDAMDTVERRMLLNGNSRLARNLYSWWTIHKRVSKQEKLKAPEKIKRNAHIRAILSKLTQDERATLSKLTLQEFRALCR